MEQLPNHGAFVISLDFELYWGVSDFMAWNPGYQTNLLGERKAVPAILEVFEEFGVAATWATVGFLFADSKSEIDVYKPKILPEYENAALCPYNDKFAENGDGDAVRFAPDLIELIRTTPGQEIATHTFSHYYCLEKGQTKAAFSADIESAVAIAGEKGISFSSIVFPRNQHNPEYDDVLLENGIVCYRGNQKSWMYQFDDEVQVNPVHRAARLADTYLNLSGKNTYEWDEVARGDIANVPASIFLRPVAISRFRDSLQYRRISLSLEYAARENQIFHLWWHPHNFGVNLRENLSFLRKVLERFRDLRDEFGLRSLSMSQVAETARQSNTTPRL